MSKVNGLLVTFNEAVSDEYAEHLIGAIRMMREVLDVSPVPSDINVHIATARAKQEISMKLFEVMKSV